MKVFRSTACMLIVSWGSFVFAQSPLESADDAPRATPNYFDIGNFHYNVTTSSTLAQTWFDRGLAMCIGFNHEEGVRCFERAIAADPSMPMAYWGLAYALGPNINNLEIEAHQIAQASFAIRMAHLHIGRASPKEAKLIRAMRHRYEAPAPDDREPLNRGYSSAMSEVYHDHRKDSWVAALYAESLMILRPWQHWDAEGNPASETPEIVAVLEEGLRRDPTFPALCHLYIHAMEASPNPEVAMPAANHLRTAMPGVGHLVHMPSHIDVLVGDYQQVIETNRRAIQADLAFLQREGADNFYTFYRLHNYHFLVYGAMFDAQSELALRAARELQHQVPKEMLRSQTDFLDAFMPMPFHVMVRFGRWDEVLAEPEPAEYLPMSRAVRHYARAIAFAATGRITAAETEQTAFRLVSKTVPETSVLFNNTSRDILAVAERMVAGEIAFRKGNQDVAFDVLREAVRLDDALNYDEPWAWMQPVRHALGALLLEAGRPAAAATVYREDLARHPKNPWSLQGLLECCRLQGQQQDAVRLDEELKTAMARADVVVDRSCFCRLPPP